MCNNAKISYHYHIIKAFMENFSSTLGSATKPVSVPGVFNIKLFFGTFNQLMASLNQLKQPPCFKTQQFSSKPLEKNIQTCFMFCRWIWMEKIICQVTSTQLKNGQGKSMSHWTRATAMHPGPSPPPVSQQKTNKQSRRFTQWRVTCSLCNTVLFFCPFSLIHYSGCIRQNLYSVDGSHDPSALTPESHFLRHASPRWLCRWTYRWGLVVPTSTRVILKIFYMYRS